MAWIRCTGNTGGSLKVRTASGQIATFETNMADVLQSVKCEINATGGNGTPDNPIPINGYTEANITRCGVNLFDISNINDTHGSNTLSISGNEITITWVNGATIFDTKNKQIFKAGNYIIKGFGTNINKVRAYFYNASDNTQLTNIYINTGTVITLTADFYIAIGGRYDDLDTATFTLQLEVGSTAHDYSSYNGNTYTIAFGQTVYGGVLDVTRGKLRVTWSNVVDLGSLGWSYDTAQQIFVTTDFAGYKNGTPFLCDIYSDNGAVAISQITNYGGTLRSAALYIKNTDYTDAPTFKTAMSGKYITAELATPFDIDLTPVQIEALLGVNNVWHDGNGDTEVKYLEVVRD